MVGEVADLLGVAHERLIGAGHKMFAVAVTDHQRAAEPSGDDRIRIIAEQHRQAVSALQLGQRRLYRLDQRGIRIG